MLTNIRMAGRADRPMLRIPKSFVQLQDLNTLLKKYRDVYPYRIFGKFLHSPQPRPTYHTHTLLLPRSMLCDHLSIVREKDLFVLNGHHYPCIPMHLT